MPHNDVIDIENCGAIRGSIEESITRSFIQSGIKTVLMSLSIQLKFYRIIYNVE